MSNPFDSKSIGKPKLTDQERFPELFAVNHRIDRRQCNRVVPMKVLVLGMCRTGTFCMSRLPRIALSMLTPNLLSHVGSLEDAGLCRLLSVS